jgi:predicted phosphate transport protein (TIGR00153 family)
MFKRLLPRETSFFDYFEQLNAITTEACKEFLTIVIDGTGLEVRVQRIKDLEHQADNVTHRCIESLHKTFITPIDRHDIHNLIKRMDDVVDNIDSAANRLILYEVRTMRAEAKQLAEILVKASTELAVAVKGLRDMGNAKAIVDSCIIVHQLENEGDAAKSMALMRLFKEEESVVRIIQWKEIFEILERATDRCEDVANIIEGIVIEAT